MTTTTPVIEEELHAYLDGELSEVRHAAVEAYLREHPDAVRRLDAYRADGEAISRIFSHPVDARPARTPASTAWGFSAVAWRRAAAVALFLAVGAATGWFARERLNHPSFERLAVQAAAAHLILNEGRTEALATASLDELSRAVSDAIGIRTELRDPSGTGYKIIAARIVPQANGRAAQLVLRGPDDHTITFYLEGRPGAKETPFSRFGGNGLTTLVWEDDDRACAITSAMEPQKLEKVGREIYDAMLG